MICRRWSFSGLEANETGLADHPSSSHTRRERAEQSAKHLGRYPPVNHSDFVIDEICYLGLESLEYASVSYARYKSDLPELFERGPASKPCFSFEA